MDLQVDTTTGDLALSNNDLVLLDGIQAVAQHIRIRLRFFLGEWFLDSEVGLPYYQQILKKNPNENIVRSVLRKAILTTPGVQEISSFSFEFEGSTRVLTVNFVAKITDSDEPLVFDEELVI